VTETVGKAIRRHRKRLEMSQVQLAEAVGVSRTTVADWERGASDPTDENLEKLAGLFGVDVPDLRYPDRAPSPGVREWGEASYRSSPRLAPNVYLVVYGYLERMKKAGCSEEQISAAERIMSDSSYSQLYKRSRREKSEEDQIMDIHAAWKFIAEVIERTEGKKL